MDLQFKFATTTEEREAVYRLRYEVYVEERGAYKDFADHNTSIYKQLSLAVYYSFYGDTEKAIEHLRLFSQQDNYHYWIVLFLEIDPLVDNIKELPEFKEIMKNIKTKFWDYHQQVKLNLEEKDLL